MLGPIHRTCLLITRKKEAEVLDELSNATQLNYSANIEGEIKKRIIDKLWERFFKMGIRFSKDKQRPLENFLP